MFLQVSKQGYTRDGSQFAHGRMLLLFASPRYNIGDKEVRACVRYVRLAQLGHWMMAILRLAGKNYTVSGTYGADGLLMDCKDDTLWNQLTPLPDDLYNAWAHGEEHNSAGNEAPLMRAWAKENIKVLSKRISRR